EVGDGKVAAGPFGLNAVERVGGNRQFTQGVTLDAGRAHRLRPSFGHGTVGLEPGIAHGYPGPVAPPRRSRALLGHEADQDRLLPLHAAPRRSQLLRAGSGAEGARPSGRRQILFRCKWKGEVRRGRGAVRGTPRRPHPGPRGSSARRGARARANDGARRDRAGAGRVDHFVGSTRRLSLKRLKYSVIPMTSVISTICPSSHAARRRPYSWSLTSCPDRCITAAYSSAARHPGSSRSIAAPPPRSWRASTSSSLAPFCLAKAVWELSQ